MIENGIDCFVVVSLNILINGWFFCNIDVVCFEIKDFKYSFW